MERGRFGSLRSGGSVGASPSSAPHDGFDKALMIKIKSPSASMSPEDGSYFWGWDGSLRSDLAVIDHRYIKMKIENPGALRHPGFSELSLFDQIRTNRQLPP